MKKMYYFEGEYVEEWNKREFSSDQEAIDHAKKTGKKLVYHESGHDNEMVVIWERE